MKQIILILVAALMVLQFSGCQSLSRDGNETSLKPLSQNLMPEWPEVAQAAIGTVADGLLARSTHPEKMRPTASIAKIITALAVMEKQPLAPGQEGQTYTVTAKDIAGHNDYVSQGGSTIPIRTGLKLNQYQAMQRMLIASDNIMADILVERTFGSKKAYVMYARGMMKRMGLSQTVVADASGFSPATVSTASELVKIGIAALKNPVIARIVAQQQVKIPLAGIIKNTNQLLGTEGIVGIKTGNTYEAGSCLLFATKYTSRNGKEGTIVGVIMGDKNRISLYRHSRELIASAKEILGMVEIESTQNLVSPSPKKRMNLPPEYRLKR